MVEFDKDWTVFIVGSVLGLEVTVEELIEPDRNFFFFLDVELAVEVHADVEGLVGAFFDLETGVGGFAVAGDWF